MTPLVRCATRDPAPRRLRGIALVAALLAYTVGANADVPPPGTHGITKRWPGVDASVTNFSPFAFDGHIRALTSDRHDGVWFGLGATLEHIDRFGHMSTVVLPEPQWEIGGMAYDSAGRLWFSLGQSGRIGTVGAAGRLRTIQIVPRAAFPDIRTIAIDRNDTVWFEDFGRHSVGKRLADGIVREVPVSKAYATQGLRLCGAHVWIVARTPYDEAIYAVAPDLRAVTPIIQARGMENATIACEPDDGIAYAYDGYLVQPAEGTIDANGKIHEHEPQFPEEFVWTGSDASSWITGSSGANARDSYGDLVLLHRTVSGSRSSRLEIPFVKFDRTFVADANSVWLGLGIPQSIVRLTFDHPSSR